MLTMRNAERGRRNGRHRRAHRATQRSSRGVHALSEPKPARRVGLLKRSFSGVSTSCLAARAAAWSSRSWRRASTPVSLRSDCSRRPSKGSSASSEGIAFLLCVW